MNKNTQLYYDVILEQINLAGTRLSKEDYAQLLENLDDEVSTRLDAMEVDELEEDDEEEG